MPWWCLINCRKVPSFDLVFKTKSLTNIILYVFTISLTILYSSFQGRSVKSGSESFIMWFVGCEHVHIHRGCCGRCGHVCRCSGCHGYIPGCESMRVQSYFVLVAPPHLSANRIRGCKNPETFLYMNGSTKMCKISLL